MLNKQISIQLIQELGTVCQEVCSSLWLCHFRLFFFFFYNVDMDIHAQKCSHTHIFNEEHENSEEMCYRSLVSVSPFKSRCRSADAVFVWLQIDISWLLVFLQRWATRHFSELVNFLDNSEMLTGILNSLYNSKGYLMENILVKHFLKANPPNNL